MLRHMETFVFPNSINFGVGAIESLASALKQLEISKPLLVTDPGLMRTGLVDRAIEAAGNQIELVVFSDVDANPTESNVRVGTELYHKSECDGIIGFGGGSALDAAKGIRLMSHHKGPLADYGVLKQGWTKMRERMPEMIAIPTTAGTGSEVARGALLIEESDGLKIAVVGPRLFPSMSICDPQLTIDLPPFLTAGTGMDAFTHCVEEYLSPKYNPVIEGIALEGIRRLNVSLVKAHRDGSDIDARSDVMVGAMMGGMGFAKGLGIVHSLSHAIGGLFGGHHGTLNAIFLPPCLEFNRESCLPKFRFLAQACGLSVEGESDEECADSFIGYVKELNAVLGIPSDISGYGVDRNNCESLIEPCLADHCHLTNPRAPTADDFRRLIKAVL